MVVTIQLLVVPQNLHQLFILLVNSSVQNLAVGPQLVRSGVDQWRKLSLLIPISQEWIDREQFAIQRHPASRRELIGMIEKLANRLSIVMLNAVRPQQMVEFTTGTKSISCLLYTSPSPRDATLSRMPSSA